MLLTHCGKLKILHLNLEDMNSILTNSKTYPWKLSFFFSDIHHFFQVLVFRFCLLDACDLFLFKIAGCQPCMALDLIT